MTDWSDRRIGSHWAALAILTVCYATSIADRLIVNLLVEPIKTDLALSDFQVSLILGPAFALAYAVLSLPFGRLADLMNRRTLIAGTMAAWSVCTAACGLASTFAGLLVARIGVGVGEAGLSPAAYSILADRFPPSRLGRVIGIYLMGGVVGNAATFIAGGALYAAFAAAGPMTLPLVGTLAAWQLTLIALGALGLLVTLLARFGLRESERSSAAEKPTLRAVASTALRPAFVWLFVAYAAVSIVIYGYLSWLPAYLTRTFGLSVPSAGKYIGLVVLVGGFAGPLVAGWLADTWRSARISGPMRLVSVLGIALALSSFLTFQATTLEYTLAGCLAVSIVTSAILVLVPLTIQLLSDVRMRGHMTGIALMVGNVIGQSLGPTAVAFLSSNAGPGLSMGASMAATFLVSAVACSVAALCAYRSSPLKEPGE